MESRHWEPLASPGAGVRGFSSQAYTRATERVALEALVVTRFLPPCLWQLAHQVPGIQPPLLCALL